MSATTAQLARCAECRYAVVTDVGYFRHKMTGLKCHRYPPQLPANAVTTTDWPTVKNDDWCGEFQKRSGASR